MGFLEGVSNIMKKRLLLPIFASFMLFTGIGANTTEAATLSDIKETASQYIGTPYKYGGTTLNGIDCSAYTSLVFSKFGIDLERTSRAQYTQGTAVSKSNLQTGDLVFFNTSGSGISHVGIFIGDGKFISATTSRGVAIDSINGGYWGPKYVGAKRVADFSNEVAEVKDAAIDFTYYISRGDVALKLAEALKLDTTNTNSPFPDVKSTSEYAGAATALNKLGVFTGNTEGKFNPRSALTRAQLAKVLVEAFNLKLVDGAEQFTDVSKNDWSYEYIQILSSNKITYGKGDGTFGVNEKVTIKQMDAFIDRLKRNSKN